MAGSARATALTGGAFDPWHAPGGFDPCGYVKGWGADREADILADFGFANTSVNATSGRYETGDHIVDPRDGVAATGVDSATVMAADGGLADALATALMVSGPTGLAALIREPVWAYVVASGDVWSVGDNMVAVA